MATESESESPQQKLQKTASWLIRNKLSPEFNNANDEAELGQLMGHEGEKLLDLVDYIRKIDKLSNIKLNIPQIVVVGDTSTGKSSVLQSLTRLPFPVASGLCTRFVTETTIRRCAPSEQPGFQIVVQMHPLNQSQDVPFEPKNFDDDNWATIYKHLKEAIADAFEKMSPEHLVPVGMSRTDLLSKSRGKPADSRSSVEPQLLRHKLIITVRKPDQAHFSIVDIPGLISNGASVDVHLSEQLVREYIENTEAIILAVTPANVDLANQKCLNLVTEAKALDRTIGVITRCDLIQNRDEGQIFDLLRNNVGSAHYLKLGWLAVRNRNRVEVEDEESFDERDRKEKELFTSGKWKEAVDSASGRNRISLDVLGTPSLKRTLQHHLYKRVRDGFPTLREKMQALETTYEGKLRELGEPRNNPRDQRAYLSGLQANYAEEVRHSLNGEYRYTEDPNKDSRVRQHVRKLNDDFGDKVEREAIKYLWQMNDDEDDGNGILHWISRTWDEYRGSEPRYDAPRGLKKALIMEQTESWESTATSYIQKVEEKINRGNRNIFEYICKDKSLREHIRSKLEAQETEAFQAAKDELKRIFGDREFIDSWNPQLAIVFDQIQRARVTRQVGKVERGKANSTVQTTEEPTDAQIWAREAFYMANKKVFEIHDWLLAFWQVTFPRFVDNVIIQVVERHLLGPQGPLRLFSQQWIHQLEDDELQDLVGENQKTRDDREELNLRLEGLKDALKKADDALR